VALGEIKMSEKHILQNWKEFKHIVGDRVGRNGIDADTPRCNKGHLCERNEKGIWDCPLCKEYMEEKRRNAKEWLKGHGGWEE